MTLKRKHILIGTYWYFLFLTFLICQNAAWSKSFTASELFTPTGQINLAIFGQIFAYSAALVPLDLLLTALTIYYFGKRQRRNRAQQSVQVTPSVPQKANY